MTPESRLSTFHDLLAADLLLSIMTLRNVALKIRLLDPHVVYSRFPVLWHSTYIMTLYPSITTPRLLTDTIPRDSKSTQYRSATSYFNFFTLQTAYVYSM
jgi:hypothetical protein